MPPKAFSLGKVRPKSTAYQLIDFVALIGFKELTLWEINFTLRRPNSRFYFKAFDIAKKARLLAVYFDVIFRVTDNKTSRV